MAKATITFFFVLPFSLLQAGSVTGNALPAAVTANAFQRDSTGNLYIAGSITPIQPKSKSDTADVYVAKLSPDGSAVIWSTVLSGSTYDSASALAISASGLVYVTGTTLSADFPASASALQATQGSASQAFLAALDASGNLQNATFLGGSTVTRGDDVIVSPTGAVIVTGFAGPGFATTANVAPFTSTAFLIETDATFTHLLFASTVGGQHLALDSIGNIYIAGTSEGGFAGPMMAGAFQTKTRLMGCGGTLFLGIGCSYQYVAKVNSTATNLIYATFIDGSYGSSPERFFVDAQGNAILAGSTHSPDYPTTAGSFQTQYIASAPTPPQSPIAHPQIFPPPQSGYVTKLNPQGTRLIFSTLMGGSVADAITDLAIGSDGFLYVAGFAKSADFPALFDVPAQCLPEFFLTRLTSDGTALTHTLAFTNSLLCANCSASSSIAKLLLDSHNNPTILAGSRVLTSVNLNGVDALVACLLDAADMRQVSSIAPGQLLSIFGRRFSYNPAQTTIPKGSALPTILNGLQVTMNGIPAPLLYVAREQINVQAPFELADSSVAQIQIQEFGANISLPVATSNPSLFLASQNYPICNGFGATFFGGQSPVALNADGSPNSCANPAALGSTITVYLNGVGAVSPLQSTGTIATSAIPLTVALTADPNVSGPVQKITATSVPGSIEGVWQAQIQLPLTGGASVVLALSAGGIPLREQQAVIWTKPASERPETHFGYASYTLR